MSTQKGGNQAFSVTEYYVQQLERLGACGLLDGRDGRPSISTRTIHEKRRSLGSGKSPGQFPNVIFDVCAAHGLSLFRSIDFTRFDLSKDKDRLAIQTLFAKQNAPRIEKTWEDEFEGIPDKYRDFLLETARSFPVEEPDSDEALQSQKHGLTLSSVANRVAKNHATGISQAWQQMRSGNAIRGDINHRLDIYIEPRLGIVKKSHDWHGQAKELDADSRLESAELDIPTLVSEYLLHPTNPKWIVLEQDAGAGKTVFSWALTEYLSQRSPDHPYLAVRFENGWPRDICAAIAMRIEHHCKDVDSLEVVQSLLKQGRIVLILDALDQEGQSNEKQVFDQLKDGSLLNNLHVVMTSRFAAKLRHNTNQFERDHWLAVQIKLWGESQWKSYWQQHAEKFPKLASRFEALVPNPEDFVDLLAFPEISKMLREIIEGAPKISVLEPIRSRADLYDRSIKRLFQRAFKSDIEETHDIDFMFEAASCLALEMMAEFRETKGIHIREDESFNAIKNAQKRFSGTEAKWDRAIRLVQSTIRISTELFVDLDVDSVHIRSYKRLEFLAGYFLANHFEQKPDLTPLDMFVGHENWYWPWRFSIELSDIKSQSKSWDASTELLFHPPTRSLLRPTELMYEIFSKVVFC